MEFGFASGRDLLFNRVLFGFMVIIAGVIWITRKPPPPVAMFNGLYSNVCCQTIGVENGMFVIGPNRVHFTVRNMKYGLEATPDQNISVSQEGIQITPTDEDHRTRILFDEDRRGFVLLDRSTREFHFRR
jgi:hypothetical protein